MATKAKVVVAAENLLALLESPGYSQGDYDIAVAELAAATRGEDAPADDEKK